MTVLDGVQLVRRQGSCTINESIGDATAMHRFLPGILILQCLTAALAWVATVRGGVGDWLYVAVAASVSGVATALWFGTIARHRAETAVSSWRLKHEADIHKLKTDGLREQSRQETKMHKAVRKAERQAGRRSNVKVGLAFVAVAGMGVAMLITELFTLGLLTISSAGSALGGYLLHWRQSRGRALPDGVSAALPQITRQDVPPSAPLMTLGKDTGKPDR